MWEYAVARIFETVSSWVRASDAAALLDVVSEGLSAPGTEPFPPAVLRTLARMIPSDAFVGYQEGDFNGTFRVTELVEVVGEPPSAAIEEAYRALGWQNPHCCRINARERRVLRLADYGTQKERRRLEYFAEVFRPLGIEDALRLWLPAPAGRARTVYLERSGRDYTDREKTLLELLRPHLIRIHRFRAKRRRAHTALGLTEREADVLALVREGKTNAQIGQTLFISPHTVRKHLQHVFEKLGVTTRTAAASRLATTLEPYTEPTSVANASRYPGAAARGARDS